MHIQSHQIALQSSYAEFNLYPTVYESFSGSTLTFRIVNPHHPCQINGCEMMFYYRFNLYFFFANEIDSFVICLLAIQVSSSVN